MRILEDEGRITRRPGIGTFVSNVPLIEAELESLGSFTEMMARSGHQAGTGHRDMCAIENRPELATPVNPRVSSRHGC